MRWDDLALLLEVSRATTLTEAAARLGVDQTTVSRRLRAFEQTLGLQLVVRRRDGIDLTEAGVRAARAAETMETVRHDLERDLIGSDARLEGRLRVTTLPVMTHHHPDLFTSFGATYPGVMLEVETGTSRRSLARREADVAIRWGPVSDQDVVAHPLAWAAFGLYASASLYRGPGAPLAGYPWVGLGSAMPQTPLQAFMDREVPTAHVVARYEDLPSLLAAVRAGCGVGFMPCAFADGGADLVRLLPEPVFGYDVWCLTHPDLRATARVRRFVAHTVAYFSERSERYAGRA